MNDLLLSLKKFSYPQWEDSELLNSFDRSCKGHLVFKQSPLKTYISHQYLEHPFHITRPFYLDDSYPKLATVYLQSSSGGIVQGDWLQFKIDIEPRAAVQFTTQAGTKIHSMDQGFALQKTCIQLEPGAYLEYVPEPLVLFPHSRLISSTVVQIAADANLILSDAFVSHDPHSTENSNFDLFANELIIMQEDRTLVLERFCINRLHMNKIIPSAIEQYKTQGNIFLISQALKSNDIVSMLRNCMIEPANCYMGISALPNDKGAWIRVLAPDAYSLRAALEVGWSACRKVLISIPWVKRKK